MYKKVIKEKNTSYDDISRQYYGTTEKSGDIAKLNNNIEEGEILIDVEEINITPERNNNLVTLIVENQSYENFSENSLIDGLNSVKGAVFIFNKSDTNYSFKIGQNVQIYDSEGLFLNGKIFNTKNISNTKARWSQVEIKSNAGILINSDVPYPLQFSNCSRKEILTEIANYFNVKITFSDEKELDEVFVNEIGSSYTAGINEKAFYFMLRICKSAGLLITDTGDGLFIGRYKPNTKEKLNLIQNECRGLQEMKWQITADGLARYYEFNSQFPQTATAKVQIPVPIPITQRINSNDFNAYDLQSAGERFVCSEIGNHFNLIAVINENLPIKSGSFAVVYNPDVNIDEETDFIIKNVIRKHPDKTILTMTLPCAYTFEIPKELPLCS